MTKRLLFGALIFLVAGGIVLAVGNQNRVVLGNTTAMSTIGTCDLPGSAAATDGWDLVPTPGNWGGKPEAQFAVVWEPGTADIWKLTGRMAQCTIAGSTGLTPKKIKINALRGLANDDYCVFASVAAGDLLIGCVDDSQNNEQWVDDFFDLPAGAFAAGQDVTVKILVTGDSWPSFNTWGQLGIDYIEVIGE